MSSSAEDSSTSDVPQGTPAAPANPLETSPASGGPATVSGPDGEAGMWGAATKDFDELAAEKEASKVFALWEIAPALVQPAAATAQAAAAAAEAEAPDVWGVAPATEKMDAPPAPVIAIAPLTSASSAQVTGEFGPADAEIRLPQAKGTRTVMFGAVAVVILIAVGGGIAMFSTGGSAAAPPSGAPAPTIAAAPAPTTAAAVPAPVVAPAAVPPAVAVPAPVATSVAVSAPAAAEPVPPPTAAAAPVAEAAALSPAAPAPAPPAPAPPAPAPPAAVPTPPAPPPPPEHRVRVRTVPARATLTLDGASVVNPYDGRLPEGSSHTLVASAPDHQVRTETLTIGRRDQELTLRLEPVPAPPPPPRVAAEPAATQRTAARRRRPAATIRPRTRSDSSSSGSGFVTESPY